jgi:acetyltransferase-like isoleucine patch superfamily enzyme
MALPEQVADMPHPTHSRRGRPWRIAWTIVTMLLVQTAICGIAVLPVVAAWTALTARLPEPGAWRVAVVSLAIVPSYLLAALALPFVSAIVSRGLGWRTPPDAEMRVAEADWPILGWVQSMAATHVVRVFSGVLLRGTPVWTAYLRLCGARVGRRVYVNSLGVSDYNLLELGDDVVIGGDAHVAGHTVERGILKTARMRLDRDVTIGAGAVVDIGVEAEAGAQVGALAFVPKYTRLVAGGVYAGVPVRRIDQPAAADTEDARPG